MLIRSVNCHGFTLLELMIALALGSMVIGSLGAFFVQLERSTQSQQRQLQLHQQTQSILTTISQELGRAGYQRHTGGVATFLGSQRSVKVSSQGDELGIVYQLPNSQSSPDYVHLVYRYQASDQQLVLCDHLASSRLSFRDVRRSTRSTPCYQVVDTQQYRITHWQVTSQLYRSAVGSVIQQVAIETTLQESGDDGRTESQRMTRLVINGGNGGSDEP
ncbi:type II secretion system protein J [Vibrio zhugei]|uniref:Type II secretion system protein J n=1 Tax=Vibrio zhugei TaxID=2479546 RepID=A0ABV7C8C6_9VIBR|nr:prepilin-type N-terminal cleavage/methylation domain-containing protein [Vibrio zhugei]